jgi:sulfite reductase (NADPH) hemoprotein beta-component
MADATKSALRGGGLEPHVENLPPGETVKAQSNYLRGTIADGLQDPLTGAIPGDAPLLLKFHGTYQQDDRDLRDERRRQRLEPDYQFMIRVRLPGGVCQPRQWLTLDELAHRYGNGTLRLTTRQTFQFHGIRKNNLKRTIQEINAALLDSIGACGDVNRGVLCSPNPAQSAIHASLYTLAKKVSENLLPRTRAYHEIWLDEKQVAGTAAKGDEEPIYGRTYLPRKFKIAFAVPPVNDVDIYTQDLGFVAIADGDELVGFDVCVGGGMGRTDNEPATYPRLGDVIGFCVPAQVVEIAEKIVTIQRDFGDRTERKHARMKYTIDDRGLDWFQAELECRLGWKLQAARPFHFETNGDRTGWTSGIDGSCHYTLFIENGRVQDSGDLRLMSALREIARVHAGDFRLTPNQNLIIANIAAEERTRIKALLEEYGLDERPQLSVLRQNAMACVALPTCGLAMAESERYLPSLITRIENILAECGLAEKPIIIRMSGCPNGCSRPYVAEIGFTGRAPGYYNLFLGGGFHGQRLNRLFLENIGEEKILDVLTPMFRAYAAERRADEHFGDFVIRAGYVREVLSGRTFND